MRCLRSLHDIVASVDMKSLCFGDGNAASEQRKRDLNRFREAVNAGHVTRTSALLYLPTPMKRQKQRAYLPMHARQCSTVDRVLLAATKKTRFQHILAE